jgi:hypothetical protein
VNYSNGTIARANRNGTHVDETFISGADLPCGIAVNRTHIYWGNDGSNTIGRANIDGTHINESFITLSTDSCYGIDVNRNHIYWTNYGGNAIGRAHLDGTHKNQNFIAGGNYSCGLAVSFSHVYWGNYSDGTIGRAKLDGSHVNQSFIAGAAGNCGLGLDPPSNNFKFVGVVHHLTSGKATLVLHIPHPGTLAVSGKRVKTVHKAPTGPKVNITIVAKRAWRALLQQTGSITVKVKVTFTPDGGFPRSKSKQFKLLQN